MGARDGFRADVVVIVEVGCIGKVAPPKQVGDSWGVVTG